jgi:hypothetical protein
LPRTLRLLNSPRTRSRKEDRGKARPVRGGKDTRSQDTHEAQRMVPGAFSYRLLRNPTRLIMSQPLEQIRPEYPRGLSHPCIGCQKPTTNPKFCSKACCMRHIRLRSPGRRGTGDPLEVRFWRFIPDRPDEGCWNWIGSTNEQGMALIWSSRKTHLYAHRVAWEIYHKKKLPEGWVVRRWCENGRCMNPAHFRAGTRKDVLGPFFRANRPQVRYGDDHKSTKVPDAALPLLRKAHLQGRKDIIDGIAKHYGVTTEHARRLGRGTAYRKGSLRVSRSIPPQDEKKERLAA